MPEFSGMLLPKLKSNMPPRQSLESFDTGPKFISAEDIGQAVPPNEIVVFKLVLQAVRVIRR